MTQMLIVVLLVFGCAVYAAWSLMPSAARRSLAIALLKWPVPAAFAGPLQRAAKGATGCGCDSCDHAPAKAKTAPTLPATPQPVTFHRKIKH